MQFIDAENSLHEAIQSKDYKTPCSGNPDFWSERKQVQTGTREKRKDYINRVRSARDGCHECEVFVECSLLAATINPKDPEITGILAGNLFSYSHNGNNVTTELISDILQREEALQ
jgi:hypothetical protein